MQEQIFHVAYCTCMLRFLRYHISRQRPAVLHISAFAAIKPAYCAVILQLHDSQMTGHACEMPLAAFRVAIMAPYFDFYAAPAVCHSEIARSKAAL